MVDAAAAIPSVGAGAAADFGGGGGGGGKGGGGGGAGMTAGSDPFSDPMSGMSGLAGSSSPFGFGETPTSFGGNIAQTAQQAQDPTGTTGAQASIEQSQPSPGAPGGGIGGTQTGPASLGQPSPPQIGPGPAQATAGPGGGGTSLLPTEVPTTTIPAAQTPQTNIPGSTALTPSLTSMAKASQFTPTPTPPFGAPGAGAFAGPPDTSGWSSVSDRFGS